MKNTELGARHISILVHQVVHNVIGRCNQKISKCYHLEPSHNTRFSSQMKKYLELNPRLCKVERTFLRSEIKILRTAPAVLNAIYTVLTANFNAFSHWTVFSIVLS